MRHFKKLLMTIALLFALSEADAQFTGTGAQGDTLLISEIKANASHLSRSDQRIIVKGYIVERFKEDYYWFEDKTGRIKVEIEPGYMPDKPFNMKTELVIFGEVCNPVIGQTYIGAMRIGFTGKQR
jgi:uncharacterized protein YdeI (BOF family)